MNYLIYHDNTAFYTNWFDAENNYVAGMVVFNLLSGKFTEDGINWKDITQDHL